MNLKSLVTLNEEACLRGSEVSRRGFPPTNRQSLIEASRREFPADSASTRYPLTAAPEIDGKWWCRERDLNPRPSDVSDTFS